MQVTSRPSRIIKLDEGTSRFDDKSRKKCIRNYFLGLNVRPLERRTNARRLCYPAGFESNLTRVHPCTLLQPMCYSFMGVSPTGTKLARSACWGFPYGHNNIHGVRRTVVYVILNSLGVFICWYSSSPKLRGR